MNNLECGRSHVSEIKLKRTDTTLGWVLVMDQKMMVVMKREETYLDLCEVVSMRTSEGESG
jgi:hypothetical protein